MELLTEEKIQNLEKVFRENLANDKDEFTLEEFKTILQAKNVSSKLKFFYWLISKGICLGLLC